MLRESQSTLRSIGKDVGRLADGDIPAQIKDNAALQVVKILKGDYDLKIARQDYFTRNQDEVTFCAFSVRLIYSVSMAGGQ